MWCCHTSTEVWLTKGTLTLISTSVHRQTKLVEELGESVASSEASCTTTSYVYMYLNKQRQLSFNCFCSGCFQCLGCRNSPSQVRNLRKSWGSQVSCKVSEITATCWRLNWHRKIIVAMLLAHPPNVQLMTQLSGSHTTAPLTWRHKNIYVKAGLSYPLCMLWPW